jgi:ABC-type methionine transport system permease subunit
MSAPRSLQTFNSASGNGIIEAAEAFGASPMRIICTVLLPEASAGLLRGLTITLVSLIGYSAMAGIVGGGGVGDLAVRWASLVLLTSRITRRWQAL